MSDDVYAVRRAQAYGLGFASAFSVAASFGAAGESTSGFLVGLGCGVVFGLLAVVMWEWAEGGHRWVLLMLVGVLAASCSKTKLVEVVNQCGEPVWADLTGWVEESELGPLDEVFDPYPNAGQVIAAGGSTEIDVGDLATYVVVGAGPAEAETFTVLWTVDLPESAEAVVRIDAQRCEEIAAG